MAAFQTLGWIICNMQIDGIVRVELRRAPLCSVNTFLFLIIGLPIQLFIIFSVIAVDWNRFLNIQYLEHRATVFVD